MVYKIIGPRINSKKSTGINNFLSMLSLTNQIIIINAILFFLIVIILNFRPDFIEIVALKSSNIIAGKTLWTLITSMFMHANFWHLFVNMFSMFFLGNLTERIVGRKRFIWFYFISGVIAGIVFILFAYLGSAIGLEKVLGGADDYAVGASGALFGLLGILAVLIPKKKVYLIAGPLIVLIAQVILNGILPDALAGFINVAASIVIFLMLISLFSASEKVRKMSIPLGMSLWLAPIAAIVPLVIISFFIELPIGNTAHFGGLVAGLAYGAYLRSKYRRKVTLLNRMLR